MNTQENNKLIAEFMGGIPSSVPNLINLPQTIGESRILCVKGSEGLPSGTYAVKRINDLKYHFSWDWLMPVVEQCLIGEAEVSEEISKTTITNIYEGICSQDISATYKSVVKFINQLNNQNYE